jgi:rubrerythrin
MTRTHTAPSAGKSLAERMPSLAAQWHPTRNGRRTPADVAPGSVSATQIRCWWLCPDCGHEWDTTLASRSGNKSGCPACAMRRRSAAAPGESFADVYPDLLREWHPHRNTHSPYELRTASHRRVWWLCRSCSHEWDTHLFSRTRVGSGCPECAKRARV